MILHNEGPTTINYSVPLPGSITGRRIVSLDLDGENAFLDNAKASGETFAQRAGIARANTETRINETAAAAFLREKMKGLNFNSDDVEKALTKIPQSVHALTTSNVAAFSLSASQPVGDRADCITPLPGDEEPDDPFPVVQDFVDKAPLGKVVVPTPS